jgi:phospholipid:diacylglycerol acyltransferase
MLGIPKTIPSLLSGEMRDTAILGQLESVLGLGQNPLGGLVAGTLGTVATTFRTWGSLWAMLPRGGVDIWGADDALGAPDDVTRAPDETSAAEVFFRANETEEARDEKSARHFRAVRASPLRHFLSVREETEDEAAWDRDRDRDPDPNDGANDAGRVSEEARVEKLSEKL